MDMFVFGLPGSFGVFQTYYLNHPPFNAASEATINSIGTIALALECVAPLPQI
ncbi:uncharacterized protein EI90DRAFT_3029543 [Cantharellus anzutake]|uniref:uncharacterized protein n=1 Tax=Cantharellus anzutake TaxID=1750568 RepID=UPI001908BA05|nr:uncharacterized protein EI90DRAFT_3029543 [Cantharellus anzutake]KAF8342594.1 hypothetical protein EI90DRAFT_3029543 [Cantharellus anzutake]